MDCVRLGIVGIGGIGSAHFNCVGGGKISGMRLGAVCDIDPARLEYCKGVYPDVPRFSDFGDMIKSGLIDSALISVPHRLHAQMAIEALEAGLNVLTEKPEDIISQITAGITGTGKPVEVICDRREAIAHGLEIARAGDTLVLAGKGHETYQEIDHVKYHMDEREIVARALGNAKAI